MEYLGLPTLTNSSYPECSVHGMDAGWCNRQRMSPQHYHSIW